MRKKSLSNIDYVFIGIIIGVIIMLGILISEQINNKNRCLTKGHNYITRCTICGDIPETEKEYENDQETNINRR